MATRAHRPYRDCLLTSDRGLLARARGVHWRPAGRRRHRRGRCHSYRHSGRPRRALAATNTHTAAAPAPAPAARVVRTASSCAVAHNEPALAWSATISSQITTPTVTIRNATRAASVQRQARIGRNEGLGPSVPAIFLGASLRHHLAARAFRPRPRPGAASFGLRNEALTAMSEQPLPVCQLLVHMF